MQPITEFRIKPIGVIHTPFIQISATPIQPSRSNAEGVIELFPEYEAGLEGVEDLSHLILIYAFHAAKASADLKVKPFLDNEPHGIFATRFYQRPNRIGISVVELTQRTEAILKILHVDMLDGTPLLDIKPYVPEFDIHRVEKMGWYEKRTHSKIYPPELRQE